MGWMEATQRATARTERLGEEGGEGGKGGALGRKIGGSAVGGRVRGQVDAGDGGCWLFATLRAVVRELGRACLDEETATWDVARRFGRCT